MFKNCQLSLPTHIYLGARKAASTWIWTQFIEHPEICVSQKKEIYYFNVHHNKSLNWYANQFTCKDKKCVVDMTPDYFNETCLKRIYKKLPNAKFFVCLRNPIQRSFSQWKFARFIKNCNSENFFLTWSQDWNSIRTQGLYDKHLNDFYSYFNNSNILILFYDDIKTNPVLFLEKIYNFLNVKNIFSDVVDNVVMPGWEKIWNETFNKKVDINERYDLYKLYNEKYTIKKDHYKHMCDYYYQSINSLSKMVNRDLSSWLKYEY